jgi:hypothetical protein
LCSGLPTKLTIEVQNFIGIKHAAEDAAETVSGERTFRSHGQSIIKIVDRVVVERVSRWG